MASQTSSTCHKFSIVPTALSFRAWRISAGYVADQSRSDRVNWVSGPQLQRLAKTAPARVDQTARDYHNRNTSPVTLHYIIQEKCFVRTVRVLSIYNPAIYLKYSAHGSTVAIQCRSTFTPVRTDVSYIPNPLNIPGARWCHSSRAESAQSS